LLKINNEQSGKTTIDFLLDAINATSNNYNNTPFKSLIISYGVRKGKITPTIATTKESPSSHIFYNHKLPIAITPEGYGDIIEVVGNTTMLSLNKNISLIIRKEGEETSRINKNHIK